MDAIINFPNACLIAEKRDGEFIARDRRAKRATLPLFLVLLPFFLFLFFFFRGIESIFVQETMIQKTT